MLKIDGKGGMPDPYDYICCLSWKSGRQGGRLLAGCTGNTLTGCYLMEESTGTILYEKIVMKHTTRRVSQRS